MDIKQVKEIESKIGFTFQNRNLLQQAYTRRSFSQENGGLDNEVLEFIGDAAIYFYVMQVLIEKYKIRSNGLFTELFEDKLSQMRKEIIAGKNLARNADRLGLVVAEYFLLGRSDWQQQIYEQESVKEDLLESIIGAVVVDSDYDSKKIRAVVVRLLDLEHLEDSPHIGFGFAIDKHDSKIDSDHKNPINYLQELFRAKKIPKPKYIDLGMHDGEWFTAAEISEYGLNYKASATSKKGSKLQAAKKLYEKVCKKLDGSPFVRSTRHSGMDIMIDAGLMGGTPFIEIRDETIQTHKNKGEIQMAKIENNDSKVVKTLKEKMNQQGGRAHMPMLKGGFQEIWLSSDGKGIIANGLKDVVLKWEHFAAIVRKAISIGGKMYRGDSAAQDGARIGSDKLSLDTIDGYISKKFYGASEGDTTLRRSTYYSAILNWAEIAKNCRADGKGGYIIINLDYSEEE